MSFDILQYLPPKTKKASSGWISFSGPCCIHNGETPDKRMRGGIKFDDFNWSYNCFNCGFKTRYEFGKRLSYKTKRFLKWMGVPQEEIKQVELDSLKNKKIYDLVDQRSNKKQRIGFFKAYELPSDARSITKDDEWAIKYLKENRGLDYHDYDFKITPNSPGRYKNRILIPFKFKDDIVGWTSRFLDNRTPKYKSENQQNGYLFGLDLQKIKWDYIILCEGVFDAISINGVALLHNDISKQQEALLRRQGKEIIYVPDQNKAGLKIIDRIVKCGFSVSLPPWPDDVTDINDAVKKYGKIGTLISIINNSTSNKIKIKMSFNDLVKRKNIKKVSINW